LLPSVYRLIRKFKNGNFRPAEKPNREIPSTYAWTNIKRYLAAMKKTADIFRLDGIFRNMKEKRDPDLTYMGMYSENKICSGSDCSGENIRIMVE
jgi:hypothetical protein